MYHVFKDVVLSPGNKSLSAFNRIDVTFDLFGLGSNTSHIRPYIGFCKDHGPSPTAREYTRTKSLCLGFGTVFLDDMPHSGARTIQGQGGIRPGKELL